MALSINSMRRSFVLFAVILAGTLILATAPAAILADQENDSHGIESFQPITISHDMMFDLEALADDLDPLTMLMIYMQIQDIGEMDTNLSEESFRKVDDMDDVVAHLNGDFGIPDYLPAGFDDDASYFGTGDAGFASFTLNVEPARTISQLLDIDPDWLPLATEHDSLTVTIDVPESGFAAWESGFERLVIGQIDHPEIDVPEEMDLDALRASILDDPRMPADLADQLGAIDNWEQTVPVPVPDGADYEDLVIDGGAGFLLTMEREGGVIVWEVDGTLHFVAGNLSGDELQQVAESMQ